MNEYRTYVTYAILAGCFLGVLVYGFNIYSIVTHTVALREIEEQTATLANSVQILDTRYLEISGKITPDTLRAHGFSQGVVSEYISRAASLGRVAIGGHEL